MRRPGDFSRDALPYLFATPCVVMRGQVVCFSSFPHRPAKEKISKILEASCPTGHWSLPLMALKIRKDIGIPMELVTRPGQPMNPQLRMAPIGVDRWGGYHMYVTTGRMLQILINRTHDS